MAVSKLWEDLLEMSTSMAISYYQDSLRAILYVGASGGLIKEEFFGILKETEIPSFGYNVNINFEFTNFLE